MKGDCIMSDLNKEIEEASVGSMMPIVTPDETLSKATPESIDDEFAALKIGPTPEDPEPEDDFDESVSDLAAIARAFKARKKVTRDMGGHNEEIKAFNAIIGKVEKYLKGKDDTFVPFSSLKKEIKAVSDEDRKEMGASDKNMKISVVKFNNGDKTYARLTIIQHPDKEEGSLEVSLEDIDAPGKYWNYYQDCVNVKYLRIAPSYMNDWKKLVTKIDSGKDVKVESAFDTLVDNGIDSVLYEHFKETEGSEDIVVFESVFGKKKKANFTIKPFEYSKDEYAKAIKKFYDDLTYGLDADEKKEITYSNGSIHIKNDVNDPPTYDIPNDIDDNINNPKLSKHKLYDFTKTYIFRYDKFTFIFSIDAEMFTFTIDLLYVEGASDYYTLDEFLEFVGRNKRAFDLWMCDPGKVKCNTNCISTKNHVNTDGIFEKPTEVSRSKGVTTIKFVDENFNESFDEEEFTEAAKIDDDIKDIIKTLNDKGYETKYSCSGHPSARLKSDGKRDGIKDKKLYSTARVVFSKAYDLTSIPEGWEEKMFDDGATGIYVKGPTFKIINGLPTDQFYKWKQKYMDHLRKWAEDLPEATAAKKVDDSDMTESMNEVFQDLLIDLS